MKYLVLYLVISTVVFMALVIGGCSTKEKMSVALCIAAACDYEITSVSGSDSKANVVQPNKKTGSSLIRKDIGLEVGIGNE